MANDDGMTKKLKYLEVYMTDIKTTIDEKIKDLPKEIQSRMDGLDELVELMQAMGVTKDVNALIDFLIKKQIPKDEKNHRFKIAKYTENNPQWVREKAIYQYLKTIYEGLKDEDKEKFVRDLTTTMKEEDADIPSTILKFLVLKLNDKIEFGLKERYGLFLDGFEIAHMGNDDEKEVNENCQDFSFVDVQKGLRGLGLGSILLHNYLKENYLQNEQNKNYTIRAYSVHCDNIVAQNLYHKFGADFLDEEGKIITQEQYLALGKDLNMLFSNKTLQVVSKQPIRPFVTFESYAEKHFTSDLADTAERTQ